MASTLDEENRDNSLLHQGDKVDNLVSSESQNIAGGGMSTANENLEEEAEMLSFEECIRHSNLSGLQKLISTLEQVTLSEVVDDKLGTLRNRVLYIDILKMKRFNRAIAFYDTQSKKTGSKKKTLEAMYERLIMARAWDEPDIFFLIIKKVEDLDRISQLRCNQRGVGGSFVLYQPRVTGYLHGHPVIDTENPMVPVERLDKFKLFKPAYADSPDGLKTKLFHVTADHVEFGSIRLPATDCGDSWCDTQHTDRCPGMSVTKFKHTFSVKISANCHDVEIETTFKSLQLARTFLSDDILNSGLNQRELYDAWDSFVNAVKQTNKGWLLLGYSVASYKREDGTESARGFRLVDLSPASELTNFDKYAKKTVVKRKFEAKVKIAKRPKV